MIKDSDIPPGLYRPKATHANCGVGVLVDLQGRKTHRLIEDGFRLLHNLDHRGARGAEEKTGDGAGMLIQKPHAFFAMQIAGLGEFDEYGVGQLFLPRDPDKQLVLLELIENVARKEGFLIIAWRDVPTDNADLGKTALASEPAIKQVFVKPRTRLEPAALDTRLYVLRRHIEKAAAPYAGGGADLFYVCSLDRRKIVYKGLLTCSQLSKYYPELRDERVATSLLLVHSRFSTNTLGAWELAHPYRCIVHNGEINTLRGNVNWMRARAADLDSGRFGCDIGKLRPITGDGELSDSAAFDNVLELLLESGRELPHALRMMIPEAWHKDPSMDPKRRVMYDYLSAIMEPWDGPALVAATDGYQVAAILDRNGLRPCRYCVTKDDVLIMASETGVLDTPASEIVFKGRLKPGQLFLADTRERRILPEEEIFAALTDKPYAQWLANNRIQLCDLDAHNIHEVPPADSDFTGITRLQRSFGYTAEALRAQVAPMAEDSKDPVGSMGNDAPLAVLSTGAKPLFNYFIQQFAQVSNPPLDYIREALVTSLQSHIGRQRNLLAETPEHCRQLLSESPILTERELAAIKNLNRNGVRARCVDITYTLGESLHAAIEAMRAHAVQLIGEGCEILVLSDRGIGPERLAIPSLLAVGALHHHLIRKGLRTRAGLVLDSGEPCLVHHFCTLIGYGADAVCPWLAYRSIQHWMAEGWIPSSSAIDDYLARYRKAIEGGILKVMSKMGISTLQSYKGAQIFEAVGLDQSFVDEYFAGTTARISGIGLVHIERELQIAHEIAFGEKVIGNLELEVGGDLYWRRDGERHQWNPFTIGKLQHAARTGNRDSYRIFARYINEQDERLQTLSGLLDFNTDPRAAVPLAEVEPIEEIFKRFSTGSMSFGALSLEAHEALAIAMNRIGGKSGTGEGGEQVERFGTERECSMKQVASGRFGVTAQYLAHAKQIEIKMAQGSKPGEGGELPGGKVDESIARVRFTVPGVGLISPPPHHDIYSIEDLKQLIHDLKCANPDAEIHVKLVSKAGVGTIAAGVAKAHADAVLISGDSGGTGASVKTSIKSAGSPWELGLAETHQVLLANNLRSRIRVRADGGFKTGRDVVVAALLGAEEYGFGTAPLIALGCIMLRKCHCNTCSVGVATQEPELRKRFAGLPEHVINYMRFIAEEVRELMASLGFRTIDEMVGRVDKLRQKKILHPRRIDIDLTQLLYRQHSEDDPRKTRSQDHGLKDKLDNLLIERARSAIEHGQPVFIQAAITNRDRTVGTLLSSTLTKRLGARGLPANTITVHLTGSAGQSFGAFLAPGITLHLEGDANDYVGKGLSGGKLSVRKPSDATFDAAENIIIGNVALYGATGGEAYINGQAGERFAVRNSGALAVVEGIGDHGCEYMTGGVVVILGAIGKNFGAGMSGGEAYVFDAKGALKVKLSRERVRIEKLKDARDCQLVRRLLENHVRHTGSAKARHILDQWRACKRQFTKVVPDTYAEVVARNLAQGRDIRSAPPPKVLLAPLLQRESIAREFYE
ncbi:MAG TPA: glutamate synthase large subunit [Gammaproteobacteria bacterium]|nr:glutamate synthase large subunit [Gammaproteobacteria bacterium]